MDFKTWRNVNQRDEAYIANLFKVPYLEKMATHIKKVTKGELNTGNEEDEKLRKDKNIKDRTTWKISPDDFVQEFLNDLNDFIIKANRKHFQFDLDTIDGPYYAEYPFDGRNTFNWHMDIGTYPYNQRKLSFSLLLSDPSEYEGGDLQIWINNKDYITIPKEPGSITFFPSFLPHRVTPITKGIRRNFIGFVLGKPYR